MFHPKREGIDAGSSAAATIHPPGWDPMVESIRQLTSVNALLKSIALTLANNSAERDTVIELTPGKADGSIVSFPGHPRIRCKWLVISPVGTGEPYLKFGTQIVFRGSIRAVPVPYVIPFPRVVQEGVDIVFYDNALPTTVPAFYAYIIGTTE